MIGNRVELYRMMDSKVTDASRSKLLSTAELKRRRQLKYAKTLATSTCLTSWGFLLPLTLCLVIISETTADFLINFFAMAAVIFLVFGAICHLYHRRKE